ncbi:putative 115 kDa protein in type-1 retrotransposable element R1DM [Caerostris darwini]|uniref:115 kDa protein in type-1 retrotransposable element R1DM n=1 Tax=Caerostris darwini TaxID=1538125 RepID=A0AAV4SB65_9ARAC|nr:putative 115 kDa protein in type-1 retrotransposable element R1DM [Caerostris darwini]
MAPSTTIRSSIDRIVEVLFPQDTEQNETPEQKNMRVTVAQYGTPNLDHMFTKQETRQVIRSMARRKAPGIDGITIELVEAINKGSPDILLSIFNKCLELAHFPSCWKSAKLKLINKAGKDLSDPKAYRPICLLPTMSKVLDKLLTQRIFFHLKSGNLLNPQQHGFRPEMSCETALYHLRSLVEEKARSRWCVCIISLDVAGAFDNVWWPSVLYLLAQAKCPKNIYDVVVSYLSERYVIFDNQALHLRYKISRGCPQGSCSGPLFWNLIADDALNLQLPQNCQLQAYADDLVLVVWAKDKSSLEQQGSHALEQLRAWGVRHKLKFNRNKTSLLPITHMRKLKMTDPPRIAMGNSTVEVVEEMKYLGVLWDHTMSFHRHLKAVREKTDYLTHRLSIIATKLYSRKPSLLKRIYKGAIEPYMLYGHGAWAHRMKFKSFTERLIVIQRRPLLAIARAYRTVSTHALQVLAGIAPIDLRVFEVHAKFKVTALKIPAAHGIEFNPSDYEHVADLWDTHPALRKSIPFDLSEPFGSEIEIYTDGSGMDGRLGRVRSGGTVLWSEDPLRNEKIRRSCVGLSG